MGTEKSVDEKRVREMRELIQQGGAEAVEKRYPGGTSSAEYAKAQKQRLQARRRAEAARREVAEEKKEREKKRQQKHAESDRTQGDAAGKDDVKGKPSMREQMQASLRRRREQDRDRGMSR